MDSNQVARVSYIHFQTLIWLVIPLKLNTFILNLVFRRRSPYLSRSLLPELLKAGNIS
jgi:hypothetical protein